MYIYIYVLYVPSPHLRGGFGRAGSMGRDQVEGSLRKPAVLCALGPLAHPSRAWHWQLQMHVRHQLHGYLAEWVPIPPGKHSFKNFTI